MILPAVLLDQFVVDCCDVSLEASEARESDWVALVGCIANPNDDSLADIQQQSGDFLALSERFTSWRARFADQATPISKEEKHHLLADLRLVLVAIRVAAFDIGLHGRGANMSDTEIADELGKYARLDCQLRANIIPPLKKELGVTDTVAF